MRLRPPQAATKPAHCPRLLRAPLVRSSVLLLRSPEYGLVAYVAIGATVVGAGVGACRRCPAAAHPPCPPTTCRLPPQVGTIEWTVAPGQTLPKGHEASVPAGGAAGPRWWAAAAARLAPLVPPHIAIALPAAAGAQAGTFKFGGSTIVVLFQRGAAAWDADLLENSLQSLETRVLMGERLGVHGGRGSAAPEAPAPSGGSGQAGAQTAAVASAAAAGGEAAPAADAVAAAALDQWPLNC